MKELVLNISIDGTIHSLYDDFLQNIDGERTIVRASEVEFNMDAQAWIVTILAEGKYQGCCLPRKFDKRQDAINAEIEFFNQELFH